MTSLEEDRYCHAVYDVQYRNSKDKGSEEPVGDVNMRCLTLNHGSEEHDCISYPNDSDGDIDWPL